MFLSIKCEYAWEVLTFYYDSLSHSHIAHFLTHCFMIMQCCITVHIINLMILYVRGWMKWNETEIINKVKVNKMGLNFLHFCCCQDNSSSTPYVVIITLLQTEKNPLHNNAFYHYDCVVNVCVLNVIEIVCVLCVWIRRKVTFVKSYGKTTSNTHTYIINEKFPNKGQIRIIYAVIKSNQMWNCVCILIDF